VELVQESRKAFAKLETALKRYGFEEKKEPLMRDRLVKELDDATIEVVSQADFIKASLEKK